MIDHDSFLIFAGTLNLIDLAGSERYRDENKGDRKVETVNINKSLSSLSLVVLKLAQKVSYFTCALYLVLSAFMLRAQYQ